MEILKIFIIDFFITAMIECYKFTYVNNVFNYGISLDEVKKLLSLLSPLHFIFTMILCGIGLVIVFLNKTIICKFIYKYRYVLALAVLILCVALEINGSSIGCWSGVISGSDASNNGVILGTSRPVRSDEWTTNTPMAFSQYYNYSGAFNYFSDTIRGIKTDAFIVYGQPVLNIGVIFRPFHWGYLMFNPGRGLSFFWCSRFIALFMVTFELAMIIAKKNKKIALAAAFLVAFAPAVQWWFAINGLVEMLVFGQLATILIYKYVRTDNYIRRVIYALILVICAGGYILVFYPAWQIPLAYVFLALVIWAVLSGWKNFKFSPKKDIAIILMFIILLGLGLAAVIMNSKDTILSVLGTAYPGKRVGVGGDAPFRMWEYISNFFFPITNKNMPLNECEMAVFFDFFPAGVILSLFVIIKERKKDILLIALLIADIFLLSYSAMQWPVLLAKITLLSYSTGGRAYIAVGFLNIILLIRAISIMETKIKKSIAVLVSIIMAIIIVNLARIEFSDYIVTKIVIGSSIAILFVGFFMIFMASRERYKENFAILIAFLMVTMGGLVNPVRAGADNIYESELTKEIKSIADVDHGLWIVEDSGLPTINLPIMVGAPTINSTNVYPALDRWHKIDPEKTYEEIYNRYAHIMIKLVNSGSTEFKINAADSFTVNLNVDDMEKLEVSYILSKNDLEGMSNSKVEIKELSSINDFKIYKVNYK